MKMFEKAMVVLGLTCGIVSAHQAYGQALNRTVFVSNNGNLEGSVTALQVDANDELVFVNRIVTGTRASLNDPCAFCNAYDITITPDGKYVAAGHAAGVVDGVSIFSVNPDSSIQTAGLFQFSDTPIDLTWVTNDLLAVVLSDQSPDRVAIYRFNPAVPSLTLQDFEFAGTGTSYIVAHPSGEYVFVNDSSGARQIISFRVSPTGMLTQVDTATTGAPFALELAISPDGSKIYGAGGISDGGNKVTGFSVDAMGMVDGLAGTPFISQGASPSNVFVTRDDKFVVVGHGTDATMRTMSIDQVTGALTATGFMFDVGQQGTLGDVHTLPGLAFVTDNSTSSDGLMGIYSFKIGNDGSLTQLGPIVSTQGIAPRSIVAWDPPVTPPQCDGDTNGDGQVDGADLSVLLANFGDMVAPGTSGDLNGDGQVDGADLSVLLSQFGCGVK